MSNAPIFISHAAADAELADALTQLLRLGADASQREIFCSSVPETGIATGDSFVQHIGERMHGAQLVVYLITPAWQESAFCLCELGAGWALGHRPFPLLVPPSTFADLKAVLTGVQAGRIDEGQDLDKLFDAVKSVMGSEPATSGWTRHRDAFLLRLASELLPSLTGPTRVPAHTYQAALDLAAEHRSELQRLREDLATAEAKLVEMAEAPDAASRRAVLVGDDEQAGLDQLVDDARTALLPLPACVVEVVFHDAAGLDYAPEDWDEIDRQVADGRLHTWDEDRRTEVVLNTDDPGVSRAQAAVSALTEFAPSPAMREAFRDRYDLNLDFRNRRVCGKLGLL